MLPIYCAHVFNIKIFIPEAKLVKIIQVFLCMSITETIDPWISFLIEINLLFVHSRTQALRSSLILCAMSCYDSIK